MAKNETDRFSRCCETESQHAERTEADYRFCASYCGDSRHLKVCALGIGGPDHQEAK